jgi:hypothetical protein
MSKRAGNLGREKFIYVFHHVKGRAFFYIIIGEGFRDGF